MPTARGLKRKDIKTYAESAIEELVRQHLAAKSESKKQKLEARIRRWKGVLVEMSLDSTGRGNK